MANTYPEQMLKRKYDNRTKVENLALVDTGFLHKVPRTVGPDGESFTSFIQISGGVGWAGTRQGARAIAGQGGRRGNGSFQQIKNSAGALKGECEVRERDVARGDAGDAAALRAIAATVDGHLAQFGQMVEWMAMGDNVSMRVCTGTIVAGVITITSHVEHVTRLRQDMLLVASLTAGTSGSLVGGGSIGYVQRVQRLGAAPTISVSPTSGGAIATPAGWTEATTLHIFMYETYAPANGGAGIDAGVDGDTSGFVFDTIESWNPAAGVTATPFKTMIRTTEDLLGGLFLSDPEVANLNILQRLAKLAVLGRSRAGWKQGRAVHAYVHTTQFHAATTLLQREDVRQAGYRMGNAGKAETGYDWVEIICIGAKIVLEECPMYDPTICRMTNPEDWNIHSSHGFPQVVSDIDGLKWIRDKDNDTYVLQYSAYPSIRTRNPAMTAQCPLD